MLELLNGFVGELRNAGIPVSLTENLDAFEAVKHIPIEDREAFKFALAATMVKNASHWKSFETVFEVYFSLRGPQYQLRDDPDSDDFWREMQEQMQGEGKGAGGAMDSLTPEEMMQLLYNALMHGDEALMRALARQAVQRFAGMEPGRPVGGTYYLYRTLRNLDLDGMMEKLMEAQRDDAEQHNADFTDLEERLERDEFNARIEQFKKEIEAEIRRRLVADRGIEAMAKTLRKPLPEDVEFMHASREEMTQLRKALQPLTRKLAARLGAQAQARAQGTARLPQHDAPLTVVRRCSGRAEVQVPAAGEARADGGGGHLRFGCRVRPLHADARVRDPAPVLQGPLVRVHRRNRRGDRLLQRRRGRAGRRAPGEHRGGRRLGRRSLGLRPCVRGVLGALRQGRRSEDDGAAARRRAQQLPRLAGVGGEGDPPEGAPRVLAEPRAALVLEHR